MAKHLLFDAAARDKLLRGATLLADAVRVTLGPRSKSVLIGKRWGEPIVCNDGVTIAKEIELEDREEDLGARMIRQAAEKTGSSVGDGTTTSAILAHAIFSEGLRNVAAGASAIDLKRAMDQAVSVAVGVIKGMSRPLASHKERAQVASVSAHNDSAIGELVSTALERVGSDGAITVEEAKGTETELEMVEGMQLDRGFLSPYFVTNPTRRECVLEDAYILLHEKRIASLKDLLPLLEAVAKSRRPLLVIAEEVEGEALATLVVNKLQGTLPCCAIKAPGFGDRRKAMMEDLAVITGGTVVAEELGQKLDSLGLTHLGRARRIVIDHEHTTVVDGAGNKRDIQARVEDLREQVKSTKSDYDREQLQARLAKLAGGVAVIRVGAPSEAELKSRKEAFDDAISATRAAVAEGIVPGAGLALLRALPVLELEAAKADGDRRTGMRILAQALTAPTRQLAKNSGYDGGVVVDHMLAGKGAYGFDAATGTYVDLMEAGIIDATKVVRTALENAVSVAGLLLLTEATLTDLPEPRAETDTRASAEF